MNRAFLLNEFSVSEQDVIDYRNDNVDLIGIDQLRLSSLLLIQLASASKHRLLNTHHVTSVIRSLENKRKTSIKGEEEFKHPPLKGLWKAHYFDESFILRNIYNEWSMFNEKSPKFNKLCAEVIKEEHETPSPHGWQGRLAHKLTIEGFDNKTKNGLTGEWIIFGKNNGTNYYLGLAQHTKPGKEDEVMYEFLKQACMNEFPHLFTINA